MEKGEVTKRIPASGTQTTSSEKMPPAGPWRLLLTVTETVMSNQMERVPSASWACWGLSVGSGDLL